MFLSALACISVAGARGFALPPSSGQLRVNLTTAQNTENDKAALLQRVTQNSQADGGHRHAVALPKGKAGRVWQAWVVGVVMLLVLAVLITELVPPSIVMLVALCSTWALGILTDRQALQGFSNSSLVVVGSMFLVIKGVDRSKMIDRAARATLGGKTSEAWALVRLCFITTFFGCFINNAPLVGLFMPIVRDWARAREFAPSKFLMPLSFASVGGGTLTLIGTSTNLVINGMMLEETGEVFRFFDPARVGIFQNIFTLLYLLSFGRTLLPEAKGGLFRTLRERKEDMVTELQVEPNFPLVGASVVEVAEALGIPREAVLKIFRRPLRKSVAPRSRLSPAGGAGRARLKRASTDQSTESEKIGNPPDLDWPGLHSFKSSPLIETAGAKAAPSYWARTHHCWGKNRDGRSRAMTDSHASRTGLGAPTSTRARPRALSTTEAEETNKEADHGSNIDPNDPDVYEIFPVPDHEAILAGDVLLLSLPRDACVDFVDSSHVAKLLSTESASEATGADRVGLRMCNMDLLEIPGRQGEYAELIISELNPFVGMDFFSSASARRQFEEHYQVAVLAVRQKSWGVVEEPAKGDMLLSYTHTHKHQRLKRLTSSGSVIESVDGETGEVGFGFGRSPTEASESSVAQDSAACTGAAFTLAGSPEPGPDDAGSTASAERRPQQLRQGDAVLVLAKAGVGQQFPAQDFLVQTTVAHEPAATTSVSDYIPLLLFAVGIVLVAIQKASMVQVSMVLAALYLLMGWVTIQELREDIDWNMLVLIGSALGLAKAVQASGLSGAVAAEVKRAQFGQRGTVFILFLVTMLITELVTNNAAAAVAFPLAADISRQMGLASVKPLAMTVMLATSACYMNPIGAPQHLMIMGPGGYTFKDFVKVGFMMDLICLLSAGVLVPVLWPMEELPGVSELQAANSV